MTRHRSRRGIREHRPLRVQGFRGTVRPHRRSAELRGHRARWTVGQRQDYVHAAVGRPIEHMIARSEAHDSGLCAATNAERRRFATDPLNLTLAAPAVNRYEKIGKDSAEWLPRLNQCWFAGRVIQVRQRYRLTIDRGEARALDQVLTGCNTTQLIVYSQEAAEPTGQRREAAGPSSEALNRWDDNRNGRISCAEARAHAITPVRQGHPAYQFMRDGDGDGVVCEGN